MSDDISETVWSAAFFPPWPGPVECSILVLWSGTETVTPAGEARSLNH